MGFTMAYSGKYKVKNKKKYMGNVDSIVYRSLWERDTFKWCDEQSTVKKWCSEEVVVPYIWDVDGRYHRYFVDLLVEFTSGETVLIEIKPKKETTPPKKGGRSTKSKAYLNESFTYVKNQNKWEAAKKYAAKRDWKFQVWTEDTLTKMGIMKKKLKPLKPMRKPINKRKRKK